MQTKRRLRQNATSSQIHLNFLLFSRCVPDNQRTYALGLQWLFLCMFGSMPGPVIFGAFIDKTCILWEETCNGRGSCLEYNNELLSYLLVAAGLFFQSKIIFVSFQRTEAVKHASLLSLPLIERDILS